MAHLRGSKRQQKKSSEVKTTIETGWDTIKCIVMFNVCLGGTLGTCGLVLKSMTDYLV